MHLRHLTGEKIKAVTEAICGKLGIAPEQLPEVQWGEGNSRKLWEAVAEATGFKVQQLKSALHNYKNPSSSSYKPEFEARLRAVAPQWWGDKDSTSKKAELKAMALRGDPRPSKNGKKKHPLGHPLCEYTHPSRACYDQVFDQEIRALRPDWFLDTAALNKAELKAMALREESRPNAKKHPLGHPLCDYTNSKSDSYDPVFDQELRSLRPDWFTRSTQLRNSRTTNKKAKKP
jgi:hypothetical protein